MRTLTSLSVLFSIPDEELMGRVQAENDYCAFTQLVERWEDPVWNLCARMTGDPHRGEDLKQEVFARLFEKRQDYEPSKRFSTWLWRIALNHCYDELRRHNRRSEVSGDENRAQASAVASKSIAVEPGPDAELVKKEEGEMVRAALLQLPEIYRAVLVLRHYEELKLREIAEVLKIPEGTVNSRLAEGYARMTRILDQKVTDQAIHQPIEQTESLSH